jgi:crotonobetainyl-CoA:carnitine CoA-transferase CaiB-like acyl-CoA transferase
VAGLEERAALLGLPLGVLPEAPPVPTVPPSTFADLPLTARSLGEAPRRSLTDLMVVDLSSLWAGPLCGRILADAGAMVVKVESASRPDGARRGPPAFFDLMNAGKASVAVDLRSSDGVSALAGLLRRADVVIEGSRPRALEQLGIEAAALVADGPQVWVSITGHGREGAAAQRVAFGDDAAVAGGLVAWSDDQPCFCADAVADPCSGLVAAAAALDALAAGGRWLVDVAMARVAAHLAGPTLPVDGEVAEPPARPPSRGAARALGADDAAYR